MLDKASIFGLDLFGEPILPDKRSPVRDRFIFPPFSVLNARDGEWQKRKRAWLRMGIEGEVGRLGCNQALLPGARNDYQRLILDSNTGAGVRGGVSIFDPVLCELVYRWFCPSGGRVLDPFAGGSVRGIVAAELGLKYVGIDLSPRQVAANEEQATAIWQGRAVLQAEPKTVRVSDKWARHPFQCSPEYIRTNCHGGCCEGSDKVLISLLPEEAEAHQAKGYAVGAGKLLPDPITGKCPHKAVDGLCRVHGTSMKPFGCVASPFNLNPSGTLIIRNRYSLMKCHGKGAEAYKVFRASLDLLFGVEEADRVTKKLDAGKEDVVATLAPGVAGKMAYLDEVKKGNVRDNKLSWITGDSLNLDELLAPDDAFDFVFSCPPYGYLERYSDDPRDLSAQEWHTFTANYKRIILKAVARLKQDRFACFVVGNFRDKRGYLRDFVSQTIAGFIAAGTKFYNEGILVTRVGSAMMRVTRQFTIGRKFAKTHQNVLIFLKGDWRLAVKNLVEE